MKQSGWKKYIFFLNKEEKQPISTKRALLKIAILAALLYVLMLIEKMQNA